VVGANCRKGLTDVGLFLFFGVGKGDRAQDRGSDL
jgi:hypothetical protein